MKILGSHLTLPKCQLKKKLQQEFFLRLKWKTNSWYSQTTFFPFLSRTTKHRPNFKHLMQSNFIQITCHYFIDVPIITQSRREQIISKTTDKPFKNTGVVFKSIFSIYLHIPLWWFGCYLPSPLWKSPWLNSAGSGNFNEACIYS